MTREKLGKIALDLILKDHQTPDSQKPTVTEQTEAMQLKYLDDLKLAVAHGRHLVSCETYGKCKPDKCRSYLGDFYIEVYTWKSPLFQNEIERRFFTRQTCPAPNYDQTVYKFDFKKETVEEIWVLGSRETCFYFMQNTKEIKPEFLQTVDYIRRFSNGELFRLMKELNGEKDDTPELEKKIIQVGIN